MPRLFISHSSKDSVQALALHRWLVANGWSEEDVFIDLHDMEAGESWRETLVKANVACEALLYLASPDSLDSEECRREVRRAEDDRKDVIVSILRDVTVDDPRLERYVDRQIVDLSAEPREERVEVEHNGRALGVDFNRQALQAIHAKLIEWGIAPDSFPWPPRDEPDAAPYPGLDAFDERSAGIFFGRDASIMAGLRDLRQMRHRGSPRLAIIQAASGAGKSSFLRAGLWPRLARTSEFAPLCIVRPAQGVLTGPHGIGQGLARWLAARKSATSAGAIHAELMEGDPAAGAARLAACLAEAAALAARERAEGPAAQPSPLIAIDQGEELFAAESAGESARFLAMLGDVLASPPDGLDPYAIVTIRADSVDALLQRVPALGIDAPYVVALPPLSPVAYREVITRPAAVHSRRVQRLDIEPDLIDALVRDATGADALPLLAFTLQRLFADHAPERTLTPAHYAAIGGIAGSIDRKLADALGAAGAAGTEDNLRRLVVPGLATWDQAAGAAKRRVAPVADVADGERADLLPLAEALVEARLLTRGEGTVEVAHETLLRRPPIDGWLEELKDWLALRDDILREAEDWESAGRHAESLVRRGERLSEALGLLQHPDFAVSLAAAADYLAACRKTEVAARRRVRRTRASIYALMLGVIAALLGVIYKEPLGDLWFEYATVRPTMARSFAPHVRTPEAEAALEPGDAFRECAQACPEMVVVPAGAFRMGSPDGEGVTDEHPRHTVTIARPFAVGRFEVTWDEWEACVAMRGCDGAPTSDGGYGKGGRPVINVSWDQASDYVKWLSRMTVRGYRLLSEAEWEYAARGVTSPDAPHPAYPWGEEASHDYANYGTDQCCAGRTEGRDEWDFTAPVGQFPANAFGLHDMHGNVWEWVDDVWHDDYRGAPADGSAWDEGGDGSRRVVRGGSWFYSPDFLRSAIRNWYSSGDRNGNLGFRVGRTLTP